MQDLQLYGLRVAKKTIFAQKFEDNMHNFNPWHHVSPEFNEDMVNGIIEIPKGVRANRLIFCKRLLSVIRVPIRIR